jgi:hypothetical protein
VAQWGRRGGGGAQEERKGRREGVVEDSWIKYDEG